MLCEDQSLQENRGCPRFGTLQCPSAFAGPGLTQTVVSSPNDSVGMVVPSASQAEAAHLEAASPEFDFVRPNVARYRFPWLSVCQDNPGNNETDQMQIRIGQLSSVHAEGILAISQARP